MTNKTAKELRDLTVKESMSLSIYLLFTLLDTIFGNCTDISAEQQEQLLALLASFIAGGNTFADTILENDFKKFTITDQTKINNFLGDKYTTKEYKSAKYKYAFTVNKDNLISDKNLMYVDVLSDYNFYSKCYEKNIIDKELLQLPYYYGAANNIKNIEIDELYNLGDFFINEDKIKNETFTGYLSIFNKDLKHFNSSRQQLLGTIVDYNSLNSKSFSELTPFNVNTNMNLDFGSDGLVGLFNDIDPSYNEKMILFMDSRKDETVDLFTIFVNTFSELRDNSSDLRTALLSLIDILIRLYVHIIKNYGKRNNNVETNISHSINVRDLLVQQGATLSRIQTQRPNLRQNTSIERPIEALRIYIEQINSEQNDSNSIPNEFQTQNIEIDYNKVKAKILESMNKNISTIEQFVDLKPKVEPLYYIIEKVSNSQVIERNVFTADNKNDLITFIDTRVKNSIVSIEDNTLENEFTYRFRQIVCVYAQVVKYNFVNSIVRTKNDFFLQVKLKSYQIIPTPYVKEVDLSDDLKVAVFDDPPIFPDVKFVSDIGVNNKLRILLNHNVGTNISIPNFLDQTEQIYFKDIHTKQKSLKYRNLKENQVNFREDDVGNKYEIYRLEYHPESYLDFKDNGIQIPDESFVAPSFTFTDSIEPNKKYYYLFRTRDIHNQLSDLSYIYEVELFNDEGVIIPNIKIVEPRINNDHKIPFKKFMKKVKIRPNLGQLLYKMQDDGSYKFGVSNKVLLNKSLCLRVTSKQTGRVIEYRFKFVPVLQKPVSQEEQRNNNC